VSGLEVVLTLLLATLAGLDLVSWPQAQLSRPLVAGLLGGLAVGSPLEGLGVGAVLELFALETLPVGAARYPDWGPGAVAAGALAGAGPQATAPAGLLGVVMVAAVSAWSGGWLMHLVRRANAEAMHARRAAIEAGDHRALSALQRGGLLRDAARSLALGSFALVLGDQVSTVFANAWDAPALLARGVLAASSVGVALWAAWRLFGQSRALRFLAGGIAAGTGVALWLR